MDIQNALERLCSQCAPSGFERPAAEVAAELLRPFVDEVSIDRMGNVVGVRRCGRKDAPRLLLDAHLDEIGLIVTGVEDGFLRFRSIGGVDPRMLPDRELTILTEPPIFGVVACMPPHVLKKGDSDKALPLDKLFIDVGMDQAEAEKAVPVGTPIVYRGSCFPLGEGQMCGKSMDDRACFVTLLRAAELLKDKELDVDLYIMGSTREEISGAGAKAGTFAIDPDYCVAVDVTHGPLLRAVRRPCHRHWPQYDQLDDPPHEGQGGGKPDSLAARGHGRPHRYQRLAHADQPGGCGDLRHLSAAEVYAHPH